MTDVLFVCTGNQCRSPVSAALLTTKVDSAIDVGSAGLVSDGVPPPDELVDVARSRGIDLGGHRSRRVSSDLLAGSGLVVTMTRQHLIEISVAAPADWGRFFTFADLLSRGERAGGRKDGESVRDWARRLGGGRVKSSILNLPLDEDVPDPMGGPVRAYEAMMDHLAVFTSRLGELVCPA